MNASIEKDWLKQWSLYSPTKIAIHDADTNESYTYADLYQKSQDLVPFLKSWGCSKGDRVAVVAHNRVETLWLFFALQRMGAVLVPINFRLSANEIDFIVQDSGAELIFHDSSHEEVCSKLTSQCKRLPIDELGKVRTTPESFEFDGEWQEPCQILYTSGTTGFPKGVVISPEMLFWNSVNTTMSLDITSEDSMVSFLPLFHTGGWNVLLTPFLHRGASTIFLQSFDAAKVLELCERFKTSVLFGVPTTLGMMARDPSFAEVDLGSLRFAVVGGEPMPLNMIELWQNRGVAIRQGFGLTECGPNCFSLSEKDAEKKLGSIGRPNFYVETQIVDENHQPVNCGEVGELLLRGPMCMREYWNNPEATAEAFYEGWLKTGDLVKCDEDQYYYVVGRRKEMFISGGENVYPAEVERVLSSHPALDEVAVIGVQDPQWGEVGKAFVVKKRGKEVAAPDVQEFCQDHLAKFKIPKHFEFIEEMPKGATGKILKNKLTDKNMLAKESSL